MIYLNNNTSAQTINIPYLEMSATPVPINPNIQPYKGAEITENGNYVIIPDSPYNCIAKVGLNVDIDTSAVYNSGYTSGYTDGYASGTTDGYTSGYTDGYSSGYTSGYTDGMVSGTSVGYEEGYTEGEEAQKAKLSTVTITENGQYNRPDGYSAVTVNVPTGSTINNQNKTMTATTNGHQIITFDSGFTGLGTVDLNINVPTSGGTDTPFFGKWADFTNVGFTLSLSAVSNSYIEIECLLPNGGNVYYVLFSGQTYTGKLNTMKTQSGDWTSAAIKTHTYVETHCDLNRPIKGCIYLQGRPQEEPLTIQFQGESITRLSKSTDWDFRAHMTLVTATTDDTEDFSKLNTIRFFYKTINTDLIEGVEEKTRYLKSLRIYDANNNVTKLIMPRSDGKMWDVIANQESDIVWLKSDGTYPITFNTYYEWEIPTV